MRDHVFLVIRHNCFILDILMNVFEKVNQIHFCQHSILPILDFNSIISSIIREKMRYHRNKSRQMEV